MANPKKIYWDTCVWLGFINDEIDKAERCRFILSEARLGNIEIWTSTFTLAEVFKKQCEGKSVALPESKDIEFEKYIAQNFLVLVQVDLEIGVDARRLLRQHPELKKPPDAVHLASALANSVDEMHTFDVDNLIPLSGKILRADGVPLTICFPPMPPTPELTIYTAEE